MTGCDSIRERLDDFIDGVLGVADADGVEAHLRTCAACRASRDARLAWLETAAGLRDVEPARDLWPGIRRRIAPRDVRATSSAGYRAWAWMATAAAVVLAAALVATLTARRPEPDRDPGSAAGPAVATSSAVLAAFDQAERDYVASRDRFLAELDARRVDLDPDTVRLVLDHLEDMERSARAIRAALQADPSDPALHRLLSASYRKRIGLLRSVGDIPTEAGRAEDRT